MHSSRMRTAGLLTVPIVSERGVSAEGWFAQGGMSAQGGCVSQHAMGQTPPPPREQNHRCKNIKRKFSLSHSLSLGLNTA